MRVGQCRIIAAWSVTIGHGSCVVLEATMDVRNRHKPIMMPYENSGLMKDKLSLTTDIIVSENWVITHIFYAVWCFLLASPFRWCYDAWHYILDFNNNIHSYIQQLQLRKIHIYGQQAEKMAQNEPTIYIRFFLVYQY